jgi:DNA-binding Lrp family transcriptional regulator
MPDMIYYIDNEDVSSEEIIKKFLNELKDNMNEPNISEQELKLGEALTDIFTNYGEIFQETSNNNKFNKNIILFELREMTNLSTKEIRNSLKRYKKIYFHIVNELLK